MSKKLSLIAILSLLSATTAVAADESTLETTRRQIPRSVSGGSAMADSIEIQTSERAAATASKSNSRAMLADEAKKADDKSKQKVVRRGATGGSAMSDTITFESK